MKHKEINGIKIPEIGLGTWKMGGTLTSDHSHDSVYIEAIRRAIRAGITHIDTAEMYGAGHAEELVGNVISDYNRKKFFITTKITPNHLFTKNQVVKSIKNSLKRLKTDYIDLYLIHWPPSILFSKCIKNAMTVFDQSVEEGIIKYIGVSNFSVAQIKKSQKLTKNKIITNQVKYSLVHKNPEVELLDFCIKENLILTAYSPIDKGRISPNRFKILDEVAKKYKKTVIQVSLRYLLDKPNVVVIPKATSEEHLKEILGCLDWNLKKKDQEVLEKEI